MNLHATANPSFTPDSFFADLTPTSSICERVLHVMNLLAAGGAGLGEVLPDYASQARRQMEELIQACERFTKGVADRETISTLENAYYVLNSAATVLDMTPAAMQRNNAEAVGGDEKISREEVVRLSRAFRQAPTVQRLLASEGACNLLLQQALAAS